MPQGQPLTIPDDGLTTRARRNAPLLAVHTGPGKGKSTAAFGMALRAWNQGFDVAVFQFVKSAKWKVGEEAGLSRTRQAARRAGRRRAGASGTRWARAGRGRASTEPRSTTPQRPPTAGPRSPAGWRPKRHDFYVLDEFTYPLKWGWVDVEEVVEVLASPAGHPARRDHRPRRAATAARRRRPGHRDDEGQAPDGRGPQGPTRYRVVTRSGRRHRRARIRQRQDDGGDGTDGRTAAGRPLRRTLQGRPGLHRPRLPRTGRGPTGSQPRPRAGRRRPDRSAVPARQRSMPTSRSSKA